VENKELAVERFVELMGDALRQVPIRRKTRVSKGAKLRRLEEKKQHSMLKSERSKRVPFED
jgi:ribosome-associated protein